MAQQRFRELDGLRGIAAFVVLVGHYTSTHNEFYPQDTPSPWAFQWGSYGVQLFFLISGFVVLMTAERARRPSDFVISRVSRLYPAYWAAVVASSVLVLVFTVPTLEMPLWHRFFNLIMVQRWFLVDSVDPVYWTLAIEMQFYALLLLMLLVSRCNVTPKLVAWVGAAWVAAGLVVALLIGAHTRGIAPNQVATLYKIVLNTTIAEYAPLFVAGMFAYLGRQHRRFAVASWIMGATAVVQAALIQSPEAASAVAVVITVFLVVVARKQTKLLLWRPIQFYGRISYTLYIQHAISGLVLMHYLIPVTGRVAAMIVTVAIVTGWSWLMHRVFEMRASKALRDWLIFRRDARLARREARLT